MSMMRKFYQYLAENDEFIENLSYLDSTFFCFKVITETMNHLTVKVEPLHTPIIRLLAAMYILMMMKTGL